MSTDNINIQLLKPIQENQALPKITKTITFNAKRTKIVKKTGCAFNTTMFEHKKIHLHVHGTALNEIAEFIEGNDSNSHVIIIGSVKECTGVQANRRLKSSDADLESPSHLRWAALDFDNTDPFEGFDPLLPVDELEEKLREYCKYLPIPITCNFVWQITSSQVLNDVPRLRIWIAFSDAVPLAFVLNYVIEQGADFSYYKNHTMPIYLKPPITLDEDGNSIEDPIPERYGRTTDAENDYIDSSALKDFSVVESPADKKYKKRKLYRSKNGSVFSVKFESESDALDQIKEGKVFRKALLYLAQLKSSEGWDKKTTENYLIGLAKTAKRDDYRDDPSFWEDNIEKICDYFFGEDSSISTEEIKKDINELTQDTDIDVVENILSNLSKKKLSRTKSELYLKQIKNKTKIGLGALKEDFKNFQDAGKPEDTGDNELAVQFISKYGAENIFFTNEDVYVYEFMKRGLWSVVNPALFKRTIDEICNDNYKTYKNSLINSVAELVKYKTAIDPSLLNKRNNSIINCPNGHIILNESTGEVFLEAHDKECYSTIQVITPYNSNAECPRWDSFLEQVFYGDSDIEQKIIFIHELIGYTMTTSTRFNLIPIFFGYGANGKSRIIKIIENIIGGNNISNVRLKNMESPYELAYMEHKLINFSLEVSKQEQAPDGVMKSIAEGEKITCHKKYGHPYDFLPTATLILALNNPLNCRDGAVGFLRRIFQIDFNNRFYKPHEWKEEHGEMFKADLNLDDKLEKETEGVMNKSIDAYANALKNGAMTIPDSVTENYNKLRLRLNQLELFIEEQCVTGDSKTGLQDLYSAYKSWASKSGIKNWFSRNNFKDQLIGMGYQTSESGHVVYFENIVPIVPKNEGNLNFISQ